MNKADYWDLFLETGAPEIYLLYTRQLKTEDDHVFNCSGNCPPGDGLQ